MKLRAASIITPLLLFILASAYAIETPRIVPRVQEIPEAESEKSSPPSRNTSPIVARAISSSSAPTSELIPSSPNRPRLDDLTWRHWAFCETGPVQMIYKLQDGTVTVTVKLEKSTPHSTLASVSADFEGRYALGGNQNTVACTSKFASKTAYWQPPAPLPASESPRFD